MTSLRERLFSWIPSPGSSLGQRVLHSGFWASALNVSDRLLQIARLIVLARLLSPSDFGLLGLALLTMQILKNISNLGIDDALIQRKNKIKPYLDTVWVLKWGRGLVIFTLLLLISPAVSSFFGEPRLQQILPMLAVGIILTSFTNPSIIYFQRELEFHKQFVYRMSGTVVDFIVAIVFAILYQSVWALVFGVLAGRLTRLVVSYIISDYRPSVNFSRERAKELLQFGKWMWATGMVVLISTTGDDTFVGWYLPAAALGLYQLAFRLSNSPATEVTHVISSVLFPTYSKLQNDEKRLQRTFKTTIRVVALLTVPMSIGILVIAAPFTQVFLGSQWMPMVLPMQVMAIAGLIRSIQSTGGALFKGFGVPEWDFRQNLLRAITIVITIWPFTNLWGITGTAVSITLGIAVITPIWAYICLEITGLDLKIVAKEIAMPLIASVNMGLIVYVFIGPTLWRVITGILVGIVMYIPLVYLLYRVTGTDLLDHSSFSI